MLRSRLFVIGSVIGAAVVLGVIFDLRAPHNIAREEPGALRAAADLKSNTPAKASATLPPGPTRSDAVERSFSAQDGQTLSVGNLANDMPMLSARAQQGDVVAARTLFRDLKTCERAPASAEEMERVIERSNDPNYRFSIATEAGRQHLADAKELFKHCGSLSRDQRATLQQWSQQLADAGDEQARLEYLYTNLPHDADDLDFQDRLDAFREKARTYLQAEIDAGDPLGLLAMANGFMRGVTQGQGSPFGVDPQEAYTYYFAYGLTQNPELDTTQILAGLSNKLTQEQISQAQQTAQTIYANCCGSR